MGLVSHVTTRCDSGDQQKYIHSFTWVFPFMLSSLCWELWIEQKAYICLSTETQPYSHVTRLPYTVMSSDSDQIKMEQIIRNLNSIPMYLLFIISVNTSVCMLLLVYCGCVNTWRKHLLLSGQNIARDINILFDSSLLKF